MTTSEYYARITKLRKTLAEIRFNDQGRLSGNERSQKLYAFSVEVDDLRTELES